MRGTAPPLNADVINEPRATTRLAMVVRKAGYERDTEVVCSLWR